MRYRVNNLTLPLDCGAEAVRAAAVKRAGLQAADVTDFRIVRQSVDARRTVQFVYAAELETDARPRCDGRDVLPVKEDASAPVKRGSRQLPARPVVVGTGPAGLFAALTLARAGYEPVVLERGAAVEERSRRVEAFWNGGGLDAETNVQFGEGGAGTFSDGKLTTRTSDPHQRAVLEDFCRFGASPDILVRAKPHIGTDVLKTVVRRMREEIIRLGGSVRFETRLDGISVRSGALDAIRTEDGSLEAAALILAIGHSARDTYQMLLESGVAMEQKPFSIGVRIEHPQAELDCALYGAAAGHPKLWPAEYQLSCRTANGRNCYSFCMCPGGLVVNASSEPGGLVANGMSEARRDRENANAALCVGVGPADFESAHPLAGVAFQRRYEQLAFQAGGSGWRAPVQCAGDFLEGRPSARLRRIVPTYSTGVQPADLHTCLPPVAADAIADGIRYFTRRIRVFGDMDAPLTGVETRTSAPVRILRDETGQSPTVRGLYPAGEGAGYAGGIMSAAVDGIRAAENLMGEWAWKQ